MGTTSTSLLGIQSTASPNTTTAADAWQQSLPLYVLHMDDEVVHWVDGQGTLYSIQPGQVYEFTNRFFGRKCIEHKWMHGLVEVELVRTVRGIEFLLDRAKANALTALHAAEQQYVNDYIEIQSTDRLANAKPAMKPSARQQRKIKKHKINLEDYGIRPVGSKSTMEGMMEKTLEQNQLMMGILVELLSGKQINPATVAGLGRTVAVAGNGPTINPVDLSPSTGRENDDVIGEPDPDGIPDRAGLDVNDIPVDQVVAETQVRPIVEYTDPNADLPTSGLFEGDVNSPNPGPSPSVASVLPHTPIIGRRRR